MSEQRSLVNELPIRLNESWRFFYANLRGISTIILPPITMVTLLSMFVEDNSYYWFVALSFILYPSYGFSI